MPPEIALALALLSPAKEPPRPVGPTITVPAAPVRVPQPMPQRQTVPAGWHVHRCAHGHEWAHSDAGHRGNVADHTCPVCGMGPYWNPVRHGPTTLASPPAAATGSVPRPAPFAGGWVTPRSVTYLPCPPGKH